MPQAVGNHLVPMGRQVDDVRIGYCATTAAKVLCPSRMSEGEESEENEDR